MPTTFELTADDGVIKLPDGVSSNAHCVVTVLDDDLHSLRREAEFTLPESSQRRMSELLEKNREGTISSQESEELNRLSEEFDRATLTKGRAMAVLASLNGDKS